MPNFIDRSGVKYGRLTARWVAGRRNNLIVWLCSCDCGALVLVEGSHIGCGHTKSCGCLQKELAAERAPIYHTKHGQAAKGVLTPEYISYLSAKNRCENPNNGAYAEYGGRGIKFEFKNFQQWISVLGKKPTPQHSIDRVDVDGNYSPTNVRWATPKQQANNRREKEKRRPTCHPERQHLAKGMCRQCYRKKAS